MLLLAWQHDQSKFSFVGEYVYSLVMFAALCSSLMLPINQNSLCHLSEVAFLKWNSARRLVIYSLIVFAYLPSEAATVIWAFCFISCHLQ